MKREDMKVCPDCGWYEHGSKTRRDIECSPDRGAMVDRLTSAVSVPSSKLGYGTGNFVFRLAENFHLQMTPTVRSDAPGDRYRVERLFMLRSLSHADAVDLVETLARWRDRTARRANPGHPGTGSGPFDDDDDDDDDGDG